LTTYIYYDILLRICIKKRKKYGHSAVSDVGMNGFLVTLKRSHVFALIRNVIALIGKNPARTSKKGWSKAIRQLDFGGYRGVA